jgi:hypothetical protein
MLSAITCPACSAVSEEQMPEDVCVFFYECASCHALLRPLPGDCCVFCSFGSVRCLPVLKVERRNDDVQRGQA